jgi:16S rRNA processing protein RimM
VVLSDLGTAPERFAPGLKVFLGRPERAEQARLLEVERSWIHGGNVVLKFRGVDSRTDAEALEGAEIWIPMEARPPAPDGEFYLSDLIGCKVLTREGKELGDVEGWQEYGGPPLLEVGGAREILIPFVRAICVDIDQAARRITVDLPEGLEELNS